MLMSGPLCGLVLDFLLLILFRNIVTLMLKWPLQYIIMNSFSVIYMHHVAWYQNIANLMCGVLYVIFYYV